MKLLLVTAVLLLATTANAEDFAKKYSRAARHAALGQEALKANDAAKASQEFEEALKIMPDLPEAHLGMGHLAMGRKDFESAYRAYTAAREAYIGIDEKLKSVEYQRYIDARKEMNGLTDLINAYGTPNSSSNANTKGMSSSRVTMQQGTYQNQVDRDKKQEMPDKKNPQLNPAVPAQVYFMIGNALFRMNRYDEARDNWETCISIAPDFAPVYNNLAVIYLKQQRYTDAKASLVKAEELGVKVNPEFMKAVDAKLATPATPAAPVVAPAQPIR